MSQPPGWVTVYDPHPVRRFFHRVVLYLGLVEGYPEPDDDVDIDLSDGDLSDGDLAERDLPAVATALESALVEDGLGQQAVGEVVDESVNRQRPVLPGPQDDGVPRQ
jgi:hypothetical protein